MTIQIDSREAHVDNTLRTRESDVTRVLYSSLIMRPIYELEARRFTTDGEEGQDLRAFMDLMWAAFAILDSVSELTEYHVGATRKEVLKKVAPAIQNQVLAAGGELSEGAILELLKKVFDHLVNRDNRYLPFEYRYFEGASGSFKLRKFWLIKAVYTGKGQETLFSLTEEGYVAYFGLHETSALDSAAIGNLRIKLLIERGNVDDAIAVAEQNNKQCTRKTHDIRNTRRAIQRNIHSIDFDRVNAMADEGTGQATLIQQENSRLHHMVLDNLQVTEDEVQEIKLLQLARHLNLHYEAELTEPLMEQACWMIRNRVQSSEGTMMEDLLKEAILEEETPLLAMAVALAVFQTIVDHRTGSRNGFQVKLFLPEKRFSIALPGGRLYRGHHLVLTPVENGFRNRRA